MTFTRTASGINNFAVFFGAEITVYVEGKKQNPSSTSQIPSTLAMTSDELFHNAVLTTFAPSKKFKVKSVGCKNDLNTYAINIGNNSLINSFVIYDSDYEGVLSSWIGQPWIMRTAGYSWENDLWVPSVCEEVISIMSGGRPWNRDTFNTSFQYAATRCTRLSRIEVCCRFYGKNLIVPNGNSIGLRLNPKSMFIVECKEASRLIAKVKNDLRNLKCQNANLHLSNKLKTCSTTNLIRGHIWEAICVTLIISILKKIGACHNISIDNVRNVALGIFVKDPLNYLSPISHNHYKSQISNAGI